MRAARDKRLIEGGENIAKLWHVNFFFFFLKRIKIDYLVRVWKKVAEVDKFLTFCCSTSGKQNESLSKSRVAILDFS